MTPTQAGSTAVPGHGLPPVQSFHPATFQERGASIPFTTPLLAGARARSAENAGLELSVPNPSGGRGVYIVPWSAISTFCRPTLHDKMLTERLAGLKIISPATVRQVAREVAAEGLAGEEAKDAAILAGDRDKADRVVANYRLLLELIEQANVAPGIPGVDGGQDTPELKRRARLTAAWIAPRLGQSPAWIANALQDLADVLQDAGVGVGRGGGRIPRQIEMLRGMVTEIEIWSRAQKTEDQAAAARSVSSVAAVTLPLADSLLKKALALSDDVASLLRRWAASSGVIGQLAARPDWLLDGWEPICLIWKHASDDAGRRAALAEIVTLLPALPREAGDWCDSPSDLDGLLGHQRAVHFNEDWRNGAAVFSLIARNEHFRAATC